MPSCYRCDDYAYNPVQIGTIVGDFHRFDGTVVLPEGFEGYFILCRKCADELDSFMDNDLEVRDEENGQ